MKKRFVKNWILTVLVIYVHAYGKLAAQTGTGYDYMPSHVNVTGGGNMPDTTNGYICNCDGTGATDATSCLQTALNTAASQGKPLLIPYTTGYYKISGALSVNCSVIGVGGTPTIKQVSDAHGLRLVANMTGWIYNLHIVGNYTSGTANTEYMANIAIGGVNGVTIKGCTLENTKGDAIGDIAQDGDGYAARNVLIDGNSLINPYRCCIALVNQSSNWAIMNNYLSYTAKYVNVIDIEPYQEASYISDIEIGYNKILSLYRDSWQYVISVTAWFDLTPGENIYIHHSYGSWPDYTFVQIDGNKDTDVPFSNVVVDNNAVGDTPSATSDTQAPSIPSGLEASISDKSFTLSWNASTDNVGVTAYEVFKSGVSFATTMDTSISFNNLPCATAYAISVKARDAAINWSAACPSLIVITPACAGSDTIITFEDRPTAETALTGIYSDINWGSAGWATYKENSQNPASNVLKMNSGATSEQTDTIFVLSGKVLKRLNIAALGNPGVKKIILSSTGNPVRTWTDMISSFSGYETNWTASADTIIVKITCSAGASSIILDNLAFGDAQAPSVPVGLASSLISFRSATLSWNASTDNTAVAGYEVFKDGFSLGTIADTSVNLTGLFCATEYILTVRAKDPVGNWSSLSAPFSITTSDCDIIPPSIPTGLDSSNVSPSSFVLSWNPSTDNDAIAGYDVFKDGVQYGNTTTGTTMNIIDLLPSTAYSMTVKAKDISGNLSDASKALIVTSAACTDCKINIALNKTVTYSSQETENTGAMATDGNTTTRWAASSGVANEWIIVDLGENYDISGAEIMWEVPEWIYKYKIETSSDNSTWTMALDNTANTYLGQIETVSFTSTNKRYIRLTITGWGNGGVWASLYEFRVFGEIYTEIENNNSANGVLIYPNPANKNITILNIEANANISIYSVDGKVIFNKNKMNNSELKLSIDNWNRGIYFLKIQSERGLVVKKIIVE